MNMNYFLVIVNEANGFFSMPKRNTPKNYNSMRKQCDIYEQMFLEKYKVKRIVPTKTGYKFI
jgi:hypothetical protein